jgi:hypothetical protein
VATWFDPVDGANRKEAHYFLLADNPPGEPLDT